MLLGGPLNANQNELRNAVKQNLSAAPGSPVAGQFYYDTTIGSARFYNGTVWVNFDPAKAANASIPIAALATNPLDRGNHTGTQLASTISNLDGTIRGYRLDQFAAPTAAVAFGSQRLTNLADPTGAQDAATRSWVVTQVEQSAAGISSKPPVRVVATTNQTLSGTPTVDGVTTAAGDRILLTGQTDGTQNGPWVIAAGAWTRPPAGADQDELTPGALWLVLAGTTYAATQWRLATTGAITPGTTAVSIVQFGAASTYAAGVGLTLTGNTFAVGAGAGILAAAGATSVDFSIVGRKYTPAAPITGDGATTAFTITHNLSNVAARPFFYEVTSGDTFEPAISGRTASALVANITPAAPTGKQYGYFVIG